MAKTKLVSVKIDGREYQLPNGWENLPEKQLILVYEGDVTNKITPGMLAKQKTACRYCLGCDKASAACTNDQALLTFMAKHTEFRFLKKNPQKTNTIRVVVARDDISSESLKMFYAEVQKAKTCPNGAVSIREFCR